MSDHKPPTRHWQCYLNDMIDFCEKVMYYTSGIGDQQASALRRMARQT